ASVRLVQVGSETGLPSDLALFRRFFSKDAQFVMHYGSTEAMGVSQWTPAPDEVPSSEIIPIGRPFPGKEILVLGSDGNPVTAGEIGELAVRSRFIGEG